MITGANRGLGAAIAEEFAGLNYEVIITGRNFLACKKKATEIKGTTTALYCDITNKKSIIQVQNFVLEKYKKLDVLVNNAAIIQPIEKFYDTNIEEWENLIDINILGQMRVSHAFYPLLKKADDTARIINISSGSAHRPLENWSAYCTSKAGFAMFSRCLDLESKQDNIRSFAFAPGIIDTDMQAVIRASNMPQKDIVAAHFATWLASGKADEFRTGRGFGYKR